MRVSCAALQREKASPLYPVDFVARVRLEGQRGDEARPPRRLGRDADLAEKEVLVADERGRVAGLAHRQGQAVAVGVKVEAVVVQRGVVGGPERVKLVAGARVDKVKGGVARKGRVRGTVCASQIHSRFVCRVPGEKPYACPCGGGRSRRGP